MSCFENRREIQHDPKQCAFNVFGHDGTKVLTPPKHTATCEV